MVVLQVCAFAAPTPGNFIPSLLALEKSLKKNNIDTIYAFPERARDKEWCLELQQYTKVYFLPESQARLRLQTYQIFKMIYNENDIGIVHSHFELYDIPATIMAPKKTRIFWHLHDALKENYQKSSLTRKILTKIQYGHVGKNVKLLSVSKEHAEFAVELGFLKKNIEYVPNGINTSRINTALIDAYENKRQILLFGWEVYRKGVDLIVDAAKNIDLKNMQIKVVGQDECEAYIQKMVTSDFVIFSRPVKDVNELYKETAVFLHISRAEGLSYALLEAIYAGIPVVCSDIPENQFANEFRNIIWIRNGNIDDLSKVLNSIHDITKNVDKNDVRFNRGIIDKHYSLNTWVNRVIEIYMT